MCVEKVLCTELNIRDLHEGYFTGVQGVPMWSNVYVCMDRRRGISKRGSGNGKREKGKRKRETSEGQVRLGCDEAEHDGREVPAECLV